MVGLLLEGCLTMTYFRTGNLHYHRRAAVSRSCSRWEGVVPTGCGRQALSVGDRTDIACDVASVHRKGRSKAWVRLRKHRNSSLSAHSYGVKPHGLLVSVSLRRCRPSTPDLSTWWS